MTVGRAQPTLSVTDPGGAFNGHPFPATALLTGVVAGLDNTPASTLEGVSPKLTYYVGNNVTGTGSTAAPIAMGMYTVQVTFPGSLDYTSATTAPVLFTIINFNATTPTVTITDAGGTYNGQPFAATAWPAASRAWKGLPRVSPTSRAALRLSRLLRPCRSPAPLRLRAPTRQRPRSSAV